MPDFKYTGPRRRPMRKPYREMILRIPGELVAGIEAHEPMIGDFEQAVIWVLRSQLVREEVSAAQKAKRIRDLKAELKSLEAGQ